MTSCRPERRRSFVTRVYEPQRPSFPTRLCLNHATLLKLRGVFLGKNAADECRESCGIGMDRRGVPMTRTPGMGQDWPPGVLTSARMRHEMRWLILGQQGEAHGTQTRFALGAHDGRNGAPSSGLTKEGTNNGAGSHPDGGDGPWPAEDASRRAPGFSVSCHPGFDVWPDQGRHGRWARLPDIA